MVQARGDESLRQMTEKGGGGEGGGRGRETALGDDDIISDVLGISADGGEPNDADVHM